MTAFRPNRRFPEEMERDRQYRADLRARAEAIKEEAEHLAPRETGHYARSFVVVEEEGETRVGSTDIAGHIIEWGSVKSPPYGVLRRAVLAAGLDLREAPKR